MPMMIRINLLPVRQVKKRELGRQILILFGVLIVGAGVGNYLWYANRQAELTKIQGEISNTQKSISELEKVIGEVNNISKRKKEVEDKLKVLGELRKGRSGPVRMLDALATATPEKIFILDFNENASQVKLQGTGASHEEVASFMRSLGLVVWTPKGMGRLVERKPGAKAARVELIGQAGAIEEFGATEVSNFFTGIELRKAEQVGSEASRLVKFEINLKANYAI